MTKGDLVLLERPANAMVPTHAYKAMHTVLERSLLLGQQRMSVITGDPGSGKSATIMGFAEGRENVVVATLSRLTNGSQTGVLRICEALGDRGLQARGGFLEQRLTLRLHELRIRNEDKRALLIVDEAQHATIDLLESIRFATDMSKVAVALVGNQQLRRKVEELAAREPQIKSRILFDVSVEMKDEDVPLFCRRWDVTSEAIERVRSLRYLGGAFRSIEDLLTIAAHEAGDNRITPHHVEAAAKMMGLTR
jgi:hypothetical protein